MTKYLPTGKELAICILIGIALGVVFGLIGCLTGVMRDMSIIAAGGFSGAVCGGVILAMRLNRQAR